HRITLIIQKSQKNISKAVQKMISHSRQYFLPVARLSKNACNGHGTRHRTKNDEEVSLPLRFARSRHKLHPPVLLDHSRYSFSNSEFGASNLRRQSRHRAAGIGMITMLW